MVSYAQDLLPRNTPYKVTGTICLKATHYTLFTLHTIPLLFWTTPKTTGRTSRSTRPNLLSASYTYTSDISLTHHLLLHKKQHKPKEKTSDKIWTPPATGFQIQKSLTSLKHHSEVLQYNCDILPEQSRMKKYWKITVLVARVFSRFLKKNLKGVIT